MTSVRILRIPRILLNLVAETLVQPGAEKPFYGEAHLVYFFCVD